MATVLAGLFPPRGTTLEWNRRLNWQPIAFESEKLEEDSVGSSHTQNHPNHLSNIDIYSTVAAGSHSMSSLLRGP